MICGTVEIEVLWNKIRLINLEYRVALEFWILTNPRNEKNSDESLASRSQTSSDLLSIQDKQTACFAESGWFNLGLVGLDARPFKCTFLFRTCIWTIWSADRTVYIEQTANLN